MSFRKPRPSALQIGGDGSISPTNKGPQTSPVGGSPTNKQGRRQSGRFGFFGRRRTTGTSTSGTTTGGSVDENPLFKTNSDDDGDFEFEMVDGKIQAQPKTSILGIGQTQGRPSTAAAALPRKSDLTVISSGGVPGRPVLAEPVQTDFVHRQANTSRTHVPEFLRKVDDKYAGEFEWSVEAEKVLKKDDASFIDDDDVPPPPPSSAPPDKYDRIPSGEIPPPPPAFPSYLLKDD